VNFRACKALFFRRLAMIAILGSPHK